MSILTFRPRPDRSVHRGRPGPARHPPGARPVPPSDGNQLSGICADHHAPRLDPLRLHQNDDGLARVASAGPLSRSSLLRGSSLGRRDGLLGRSGRPRGPPSSPRRPSGRATDFAGPAFFTATAFLAGATRPRGDRLLHRDGHFGRSNPLRRGSLPHRDGLRRSRLGRRESLLGGRSLIDGRTLLGRSTLLDRRHLLCRQSALDDGDGSLGRRLPRRRSFGPCNGLLGGSRLLRRSGLCRGDDLGGGADFVGATASWALPTSWGRPSSPRRPSRPGPPFAPPRALGLAGWTPGTAPTRSAAAAGRSAAAAVLLTAGTGSADTGAGGWSSVTASEGSASATGSTRSLGIDTTTTSRSASPPVTGPLEPPEACGLDRKLGTLADRHPQGDERQDAGRDRRVDPVQAH